MGNVSEPHPPTSEADIDIDAYLERRRFSGYEYDIARDGLIVSALRRMLRTVGEVLSFPHHAFLRAMLLRFVRREQAGGRRPTAAELYVREIVTIDVWTVSWPVVHLLLLYVPLYRIAVGDIRYPLVFAAVPFAVSVYRGLDILAVLLRLHLAERYVPHLSSRATIGTLLQFLDLTTMYANTYIVLRIWLGSEAFGGDLLANAVRPVYYSFVTITTLGYGDVFAKAWQVQLTVMAELLSGLTIITVILQHVIGTRETRRDGEARVKIDAGSDRMYAAFIDRFRHDSPYIEKLFERFVPVVRGHEPVLDAACGRGEFLNIMRREAIEAYGVDSNSVFVDRCRRSGLRVVLADVFDHLVSIPDATLGAVFSAQFVEHLSPADLLRFLQLSAAKLRDGGLFIAETLTPSLNTLLTKFWVDPTHTSPVHPDSFAFFIEQAGFADVAVQYYNDIAEPLQTPPLAGKATRGNVRKLNRLVFAPHYFAVIASRRR